MPNILMLYFSAIKRSIGSTERRPIYATLLSDNLQIYANTKVINIIYNHSNGFNLLKRKYADIQNMHLLYG